MIWPARMPDAAENGSSTRHPAPGTLCSSSTACTSRTIAVRLERSLRHERSLRGGPSGDGFQRRYVTHAGETSVDRIPIAGAVRSGPMNTVCATMLHRMAGAEVHRTGRSPTGTSRDAG